MSGDRLAPARLVGLVALVIVALAGPGCGGADATVVTSVPEELHGVWRTDHPRYRGAFFECRARELRFGTVRDSVSVHPVVEVTIRDGDGRTDYRIEYLVEGERRSFRLERTAEGPQALRLQHNSAYVWTRRER